MLTRKTVLIVIFISFCLSVCLGMMDYETESLVHLFTGDPGNIIALLMYTGIFSFIGLGIVRLFQFALGK